MPAATSGALERIRRSPARIALGNQATARHFLAARSRSTITATLPSMLRPAFSDCSPELIASTVPVFRRDLVADAREREGRRLHLGASVFSLAYSRRLSSGRSRLVLLVGRIRHAPDDDAGRGLPEIRAATNETESVSVSRDNAKRSH